MKRINLQQGSKEWLEFRRDKIGASDAPCIMGVGFHSEYTLFMNKMTGKEVVKNKWMERGNELEPIAREAFYKDTGILVEPACVISNDRQWQFASLDGITQSEDTIVEIKCPGYKDHATALSGMIPGKYYAQLQHQMAVTGLNSMFYYSFDGKKGVPIEVKRDEKYIEQLLEKEERFYQRMINFEPPELGNTDIVIIQDGEWNDIAEEYRRIRKSISILEEQEERLKERLIDIAAERNVESNGLRLSRILRKGAVDYNAIPELKSVDMERYRKKTSAFWKFHILNDN